LTEATKFDG